MVCATMFSILEALEGLVTDWCRGTVLTLLRGCAWTGAVLLVYAGLLLLWRRWRRPPDFELLYESVQRNDLLPALCLLKRHPHYANRFRLPDGYTPFMVACANANTALVQLMLRMGADVGLKSANGETVAYLTAFYYIRHKTCKDASCIRTLCHAGADLNEPGRNGVTPLELAAAFGHAPLVKWLLAKKAAMRPQRHPVLLAQSFGHPDTARLILNVMHIHSLEFHK